MNKLVHDAICLVVVFVIFAGALFLMAYPQGNPFAAVAAGLEASK